MLASRCVAIAILVWMGAAGLDVAPARAADPDVAFTVANYPVEATAANAVAAKDQALADGQQAAFKSLLKRLVPVTAYKQLTRVENAKVADLVSGLSVRSERNSSTAYIANLDYSFDSNGVRSLLSGQGIPFVDQQAPQLTVVTVLLQGNPPAATSDTGLWRRAWSGLDLTHTLTPIAVKDLKPTIKTDTVQALMSGQDSALQKLKAEYGSGLVVLAIAEPDLPAKKVTVTLVGSDAVGGLLLKRAYRINDNDLDYASQLAAVVSLGIIEGRWKAIKAGIGEATASSNPAGGAPVWAASTGGSGEDVTLTAEFASSDQWDLIRSQLLDMPGVDALNIGSVSDRSAGISLKYPGGATSLATALGPKGFSLSNTGSGWVLRPGY
ncbi:DUF2066 domain-containing protein [Hyphomicrobium sp.]|uniref:DUF2066 domain-containing protein n=1 Tax=Hyphomicrobium sp. TaxID=82 RepID=UPI000FA98650|nr:DUF2066 domain-containing protein [Hyphomicrobium sp.]RUO97266.1 MAG: DUF2066 domain-containing protein [Hyphomicrobium sp.]